MLYGWALLLGFQLAGEALVRLTGVPVPGPVLGMLLLLAALGLRGSVPPSLQAVASGLLGHLSLLFVPAGVGVMLHAPRLAQEWPALAAALVGSTVMALVITGWVLQRMSRTRGGKSSG